MEMKRKAHGPPDVTVPLEVSRRDVCVSQAQTHAQRRVAQGLTGHILQPIHHQRPDGFCPQGTHGNQERRLPLGVWGMWVCLSHKHRVGSKDPGCLPGKERDRSSSSDARAIRSLHRHCPGPGKLKPASRQSSLRLHIIR